MDCGIPACLFRRPFGRATSSFFLAWWRSIRRPGEPAHGTVAVETRQILTNMAQLLEAAGCSLAKVVKVNVLIYSMLEYENMNSVYREFFPVDPPARTVCGAGLIGGHKVEIECVALA
jgi:enamine deaminase RidA (YjgF/YER057c/UK114 family)